MIKLISGKVACFLCKGEDEETTELFEYAAYIVLSAILHIATMIVLGLCFNMLVESLVFYASFILIRKFAGGYHAKTPIRCYLFSVASSVFALVAMRVIVAADMNVLYYVVIGLAFLCALFIFIVSPLDTENKPLNDKEKSIYKIISVCTASSLFILATVLLCIGIKTIGISVVFGIYMSAFVLIMRWLQVKALSAKIK